MERTVLLAKNPWWKGKEHFKEDEEFKKWEEKKIKWQPKLLSEITFKPFSLHFLFGPRQVGKTTLIKLMIQKLLEKEVKPEQIFYFKCDELKDYKELHDLLETYFSIREEFDVKSSHIFLDEITFAEEWFRTIKSLIDEGKFKEDIVFISGSVSLEIKKEIEYFPGRRGGGKDYLLRPLSFREFIKIMNEGLYKKLLKLSSLSEKEIIEKSIKTFPYFNELDKLFSIYLKIGGFPLAINSYAETKGISSSVKETYISWIKGDLVKVNRSPEIAREIMKSIIQKIPNPMSWEGIAKETSIKSPKTINSYAHTFEEMFLIAISHYINLNNLTIEFGKNKKIHLGDPIFYELFEEWCLIEVKEKENKKAENILAYHLLRFSKSSEIFADEVFYWRNSTEVDAIIRTKEKAVGFEVKWGKSAKQIKLIIGKMKDFFVLSKKIFEPKQKIIPLSIFLALLDA